METKLKRYYGDESVTKSVMEVWMDGEEVVRAEIHAEDDVIAALTGACLVPETSRALPAHLPVKADWLCCIGEQGAEK